MVAVQFIWGLEDDAEGNVQHIAQHDITVDEAEEVVRNRYNHAIESRTSNRPTVFGWTSTGKHLAVVFEIVEEDQPTVEVVTAYEAPPACESQSQEEKETMSTAPSKRRVKRTPEQLTELQAIRDAFKDWHPGPEVLIASGEAARLGLSVTSSPAQALLQELRETRASTGLTLAEVARRCGIDQPALSRLENGLDTNPTVDTLWRYAAALGKQLMLSAADLAPESCPEVKKPTRVKKTRLPR